MERCIYDGCMQPLGYRCSCQQPPALLCAEHLAEHCTTQIRHAPESIMQELTVDQHESARQVYQWLEIATNAAFNQVSGRLNQAVQALLRQIQQQRATAARSLKAIMEESVQALNELQTLMTVGWNTVEQPGPLFAGLDPAAWVAQTLQSPQLKARFKEQLEAQSSNAAQQLGVEHTLPACLPEVPLAREDQNIRQNVKAFFNQVNVRPSYSQGLNDLKATLKSIATLGVSIPELANTLTGEQVPMWQVYDQIVEQFASQRIRCIPAQLDEKGETTLRQLYNQWTTVLALAALESGTIDLRSGHYQSLTPQDIQRLLRWLPIYTRETNERPTSCQFVHQSVADFLTAKGILEDLETAAIGALSSTALINLHNIVNKEGVCGFTVQMVRQYQGWCERLLVDIVKQTRTRDDLTQASANAITLLNQMGYCFAHQDFGGVKIAGACLSGANLKETNLHKAEMQRVLLEDCTLTKANLEQANLAATQFSANNSLRTLRGHSSWALSVSFSPDGALIASANGDKTIIVWNAETDQQIRTLLGHNGRVWSMCFSPDGELIASGSEDNKLIVWSSRTGRQLRTLKGQRHVRAVCFSPDGALIASGGADTTVMVWEAATGQQIRVLTGHSRDVTAVHFSPDGVFLITCSWDTTIIMWETTTGRQVRKFTGHSNAVSAVCFSPDGTLIASASEDKTLIVWEAATGCQVRTLLGHSEQVNAVCFSPNGAFIASGSYDKTIILWEAGTGRQVVMLSGHSSPIRSVCFSPDGGLIASGGGDEVIIVWEVETSQSFSNPDGTQGRPAFYSVDLTTIMFENESGYDCWDVTTGEKLVYDSRRIRAGQRIVYESSEGPHSNAASGLACHGVKLNGAIISKTNLNFLKSRSRWAR